MNGCLDVKLTLYNLCAMRDHVDHLIDQWKRERPDLDVSPMGIIARMSRLSRFLERSIDSVQARYRINESQFGVLAALRRAGPPYCLSPTELYNSLLISSGAMTNRLDRLTGAGLIRRVPDPSDGRSMLVQLTPRGHKLIDEAAAAHYENEHRLLASLPASEKKTLAGLLRKLLLEFEDHSPERLPANSRKLPKRRKATAPSSPHPRERAAR